MPVHTVLIIRFLSADSALRMLPKNALSLLSPDLA